MGRGEVPEALLVCLALCVLCSSLGTPALAQRGSLSNPPLPDPRNAEEVLHDPHRIDSVTTYRTNPGTAVVLVTVFAESTKTRLARQAVVKLRNRATGTATFQPTVDTVLAAFTNMG